MTGTVRIVGTGGPIRGREFVFTDHDVWLFGRAEDCHARLPDDDPTVSRHHFVLEVNPPDARLRDLGSLNGSYVNGTKWGGRERTETPEEGARHEHPQVELGDGDEIRVGGHLLRVSVEVPAMDEDPTPVRCGVCGQDASASFGYRRSGDVVCASCAVAAGDDPGAMVRQIIGQLGLNQRARVQEEIADLANYDVERLLGQGGFGAVFRARRKRDGKRVALKILLPRVAVEDRASERFWREIEMTRRLRHPHVVELFAHGELGGVFFFTMELCDGGNLRDLLERSGGRIGLDAARPLMLDVLDGLGFAHRQGVVHRDLKPDNILLARAGRTGGSGLVAKVSDLGLSKSFVEAGLSGMTATDTTMGSWPYMPREQLTHFRWVKPVSDVWAIAATFYELLTGQIPRPIGRARDVINVVLRGEPIPIRKRDRRIPRNVAQVIDRALSIDPERRYRDADEMRTALQAAL